MSEKKLWLRLYHGRKTTTTQLYDWGADGPVFGIGGWLHSVYASRINFSTTYCEDCDLTVTREGLIYYGGMYYGDMEIFMATEEDAARAGTITRWNEHKANQAFRRDYNEG